MEISMWKIFPIHLNVSFSFSIYKCDSLFSLDELPKNTKYLRNVSYEKQSSTNEEIKLGETGDNIKHTKTILKIYYVNYNFYPD